MADLLDSLTYDVGLIPVIVQDAATRTVLMFAYANPEAVALTRETGFAHYYSRSRQKLWKKGEESGHLQKVCEIRVDCERRLSPLPRGTDRLRMPRRILQLLLPYH